MADPTAPTLAIVIGTRNRRDLLEMGLRSLIGGIGVPHDIVVVDAGSTDGTLEYLRGLSAVRVVPNGDPGGQARDLNRVFQSLDSKYTCWLSDDNVLVEGMLDLAVAILEQDPDIGMVALKVKDVLGRLQVDPYIGSIWPTGVLNCNQGVIRTSLFRQIGFFDEQYHAYGIDPDLTTRVLLAGHKVVYTKLVAIHHYRNRTAFPGAILDEDREAQKRAAHQIYEQKYRALIKRRPVWRRLLYGGLWRCLIHPLYELSRRLGISLEAWLGYSERDWTNLLYTRHVSVFDFIENHDKPYYLVQVIPPGRLPAGREGPLSSVVMRPDPGRDLTAIGRRPEAGRK